MDNELKRLLRDKADEMQLPPDAPGALLRRARRRRLVTGALAGVAVIALIGGGFVGVRAALRQDSFTPVAPATPSPTTDLSPSPSPSPTGEPTLGLPFPVCDVTSVEGFFLDPDTRGTALVATRQGDTGGCPEGGFVLIGVDLEGDGQVDLSYGPLECFPVACQAFAAPDLDRNGTSELAVIHQHGSVLGLQLYAVDPDAAQIVPIMVAPPGDPEGGFEPGAQPLLWASGGDGFNHSALRCENGPEGIRFVVAVSAVQDPPDSADSVWKAHETTFEFSARELYVTATEDFEEPVTQDRPEFDSPDQVCGLEP